MDDAVNISDDPLDLLSVIELGITDFLPGSRCPERDTLGEPQNRIGPSQALAQRPADAPARACDQHSMHSLPPGSGVLCASVMPRRVQPLQLTPRAIHSLFS